MARMYADETFPARVVELLRDLRHDVLTAKQAGNTGVGMSDREVLAFANNNNRAVLTLNYMDFVKLHNLEPMHAGIIICPADLDRERLAREINESLFWVATLREQLIRVYYRFSF